MLGSTTTGLQGLKLDRFYRAPLIYDKPIELQYPSSIYMMPTVYGGYSADVEMVDGGGQRSEQTNWRERLSNGSAPSADASGSVVGQILSKQTEILKRLKLLRTQVEDVEKSLQKSKEPAKLDLEHQDSPQKLPTGAAVLPGPIFSEALSRAAGDKEASCAAVLSEETRILQQLKQLRQKVDALASSSSLKTERVKGRVGTYLLGAQAKDWNPPATRVELVVYASPKYPPYTLPALRAFLRDYGRVSTATYVHSSIGGDLPRNLKDFLPDSGSGDSRLDADFLLTLIWKDVGVDPVLMVNPSRQNPIFGEANIVRLVLRMLDPGYDSPQNLSDLVEYDKWLNLASRVIVHGNAKERQSAVRQMNSSLGKSPFLFGQGAHLVDIVVLSALLQTVGTSSFSANVENWYQLLVSNDLYF